MSSFSSVKSDLLLTFSLLSGKVSVNEGMRWRSMSYYADVLWTGCMGDVLWTDWSITHQVLMTGLILTFYWLWVTIFELTSRRSIDRVYGWRSMDGLLDEHIGNYIGVDSDVLLSILLLIGKLSLNEGIGWRSMDWTADVLWTGCVGEVSWTGLTITHVFTLLRVKFNVLLTVGDVSWVKKLTFFRLGVCVTFFGLTGRLHIKCWWQGVLWRSLDCGWHSMS
jgi:hypothetical protein